MPQLKTLTKKVAAMNNLTAINVYQYGMEVGIAHPRRSLNNLDDRLLISHLHLRVGMLNLITHKVNEIALRQRLGNRYSNVTLAGAIK